MTDVLIVDQTAVPASVAERPAPCRSACTVATIVELTHLRIGRSHQYRPERARAVRLLLDWLTSFPGADWQERWHASGADDQGRMWGPPDPKGVAYPMLKSGVNPLVALEVIRPSVGWLREATPPHLFVRCREVMEPEVFRSLTATAETFAVARNARMLALNMITILRIHTGQPVLDATADDFNEVVQAWRATGRMIHSVPLAWQVLQRAGGLQGAPGDFRTMTLSRQKSVSELVACRGVRSAPVAALLTDYLSERAASIDYTSLVGLSRRLVDNFWVDIERRAPGQSDLRLAPDVVAAWKQRLRTLPDGRERADYFTILMAVRSFYLDIAQWALTDPARWARWVVAPPVSAGETAGVRKRVKRRQARMHQRTRTLAPLLPRLAAATLEHKRWAAALFERSTAVSEGEQFRFEGVDYRRVVRRSTYSDGDRRPSVIDLSSDSVVRLHHVDELAFWAWAVIEVLRHTGMRLEELLELTHLSIRRYQAPTGEMTAVLQIAPSKSDRERVLPVAPELASVLAAIIRRVKNGASTIPLVSRYDPTERTWGPKLPHLFQPNLGGPPQVLTPATARNLITASAERAGLSDVDGSPLRFTPHDLRRIFATETVNSGLPIHIAQKLLGHLDLNTTQGYVAVYPSEVIRHYRTFIDRRRQDRPGEEYREPTDQEWEDFQEHYKLRKVALGTCHRPYGTPCIHEHACVRCPMLRLDPGQMPRLLAIEANTVERLEEARRMAWLGEVQALEESLRHIHSKRLQVDSIDQQPEDR